MERKIDSYLKSWQKEVARKVLFIYGKKRVGKTYTAINFGYNNYKNVIYFNLDNNKELEDIIKDTKEVEQLVKSLSLYIKETIMEDLSLLIFDNLKSVLLFNELKKFTGTNYHVVLIGDSKESFKGSDVYYKEMFPLDFEEFLRAINKKELVAFIRDSYINNKGMPFHSLASLYFDIFLETGGFPEVVEFYIQNEKKKILLNSPKKSILDSYKSSILKEREKGEDVIKVIPLELLKDNRKFQYSLIKKGARMSEYKDILDALQDIGLIYKCYKLKGEGKVLASLKDEDNFKVYLNDTGLLFYLMNSSEKELKENASLFSVMVEERSLIDLLSNSLRPYYFKSDGKASISFVIQLRDGKIVPIEIVDTLNSKSKSLAHFKNKFKVEECIKVGDFNFKKQNNIKYIPIYATFCFDEFKNK